MRKADLVVRKEKRRIVGLIDNMDIDKIRIPQELMAQAQVKQPEPQETTEIKPNSTNEEMMSALGM